LWERHLAAKNVTFMRADRGKMPLPHKTRTVGVSDRIKSKIKIKRKKKAREDATLSTAYIAVGSNLGDKQGNCEQGIAALTQTAGITVTAQAKLYKTAPVDFTDQAWFVNTAVRVATDLAPWDLLTQLKRIESAVGRIKTDIRFGPRVLDMDIILYDDLIFKSDTLEIPHPRMHKRRFVLRPICDIDPTAMHPTLNKPVKVLLDGISDPGQEIALLDD